TPSGPVMLDDFYQQPYGTSPLKAFTPASANYATAPGGDNYLHTNNNNGAAYATTVKDITNSTSKSISFEANGYKTFTTVAFKGYTEGPNYWGKTFFIWPPDPLAADDWRQKFFNNPGTSIGVTDNTRLWDSAGNLKAPSSSTYSINYNAILNWIKNTGPNPFPPMLRAGRIQYYSAIPNTIDTSTFPPTNLAQRFWKEYIDYVLGVEQQNATTYSVNSSYSGSRVTATSGYGDDFTWGTIQ